MIAGNPLNKRLIKELANTRRRLAEVCEDLGIDYDELIESGDLGIEQCSHCNIWSTRTVPDLDENPICPLCLDLSGM